MSILVKGSGGSGGEDLIVELTEMGTLIQEIEGSLVGKATGANITPETILKGYAGYKGKQLIIGTYIPHGKYVWKKIEQFTVTNPTITFTPDGQDVNGNYKFKVTETNGTFIDFDYITAEFFNGFLITTAITWGFTYSNGELAYGQNGATSHVCTYNAETHHLICATRLWSSVHNASYTGNKTYIKSIDYVVSDDPTAYPDGAEKDGYWYEKLSEVIGVDYGEFTVTDATTFTVSHNLKEIPSTVVLIGENVPSASSVTLMIVNDTTMINGNTGTFGFYANSGNTKAMINKTVCDGIINKTNEEITFLGTYYGEHLKGNYKWFASV